MKTQGAWGGAWTEQKLASLAAYLPAYTTILAKHPYYTRWYVDGFASGGHRTATSVENPQTSLLTELADDEAQAFLRGSVYKALETQPPFHRFVFIDRTRKRCNELEQVRSEYPALAPNIDIQHADANHYLRRWCAEVDWSRNRALVFLDPFGMQVEWSLLQSIAATRAIDLWLLFPIGAGVNRLLTRREMPPPTWADALTRVLGTDAWMTEFYRTATSETLFGEEETLEKQADWSQIGQFFLNRLKQLFPGVAKHPLVLTNSHNTPLYLLCFAVSNPKQSVIAATLKIANHILGSSSGH